MYNVNKKDNIWEEIQSKWIGTTWRTLNLHYWHKTTTECVETCNMLLDGKIWYCENIKSSLIIYNYIVSPIKITKYYQYFRKAYKDTRKMNLR